MQLRNLFVKAQQIRQSQSLLTSLVSTQTRMIHDPPMFRVEDANKINKLELSAYFDDLMLRRPSNKSGYINLPTENFRRMVEKAKSEGDIKTLLYAHVNYIGHRKLLQHKYIDEMMLKALELGYPELMLETFKLHTELVYHPSPVVTQKYYEHFSQKSYDSLKTFFETVKTNHYMVKPDNFIVTVIDQAFENKDYPTVIEAYLYCYNYNVLTTDHLIKVYESQDFETLIDHGLYKHLYNQVEKKGLQNNVRIKLNQAIYNLKIKGYLTTADIINTISQLTGKIENSEFIKKELFDKITGDSLNSLDQDVAEQLTKAVRSLKGQIDADFYGMEDLKDKPVETQQEVAETVNQQSQSQEQQNPQ
eukprot:403373843